MRAKKARELERVTPPPPARAHKTKHSNPFVEMKGIILGDKNKEELKYYILNPLIAGLKTPQT
ncbi:unnamed protein product [Helicobacter felis ATCC 49179]|uniref:Uncharacterized protein n=1 Tax=Helicobacter felis (strain ATCC 49179 / CCUG 28539 / NCTC 12436 / CS1) TaxID=936155 RepID=E7ABA3_HELFC|nr:unnamed protein product [Helicobacter felis ATCC 49179]